MNQAALHTDPRVTNLTRTIERVQARFRLQEAAALAPIAVAIGLAFTLLLVVIERISPYWEWSQLAVMGVVLVVAALLTSTLYAMLRPRDLMATARRADHLLSLDERLSTALEDFTRDAAPTAPEHSVLLNAQLDDALASASGILPARDLPLAVSSRKLAPVGLALGLIAFALFVPIPGPTLSPEEAATRSQVAAERMQVEELKKYVASQPAATDDPARQALLNELDQLSRDLERGNLTREEAIAKLSDTESRLEKKLDPQSAAERAALDALSKQLAASKNNDAKEAGEALQRGEGDKAAEALKKAGENSSALSEQERKELAQSLKEARDKVVALDPELARRLNEASNAMEGKDSQTAQQAMKNLSDHVKESSQNAANQAQIEQALSQLQQSKSNIAQAGKPSVSSGTPSAGGTPSSRGTPIASLGSAVPQGSPLNGTQVAMSGTPIALGSPATGRPARTGTPVMVQSTPGKGTPVAGGQGQGRGQGQGQQPGQGQGQGQSGQQGAGNQPSGGWGVGHNEPVYAPPSSVNAASTPVQLQGQDNPDGEQSSATTSTDANSPGQAQVPYEQVYPAYKQEAGKALDTDYIPQGYKDLVRDYFTSIDPEK